MVDVTIVGGGLAGLAAASLLAKQGLQVSVFEKQRYPFHRVCGEYVSNEAQPFLERLGLDVHALGAQSFSQVRFTTLGGHSTAFGLGLGGFGLSRFRLDAALLDSARAAGAQVHELTPVKNVRVNDGAHDVETKTGWFRSKVVLASYGKRDALDQKLSRPFAGRRSKYLAVKRHFRGDFPEGEVCLHAIPGGYCGASRVEEDLVNVCYLTTQAAFRAYGTPQNFECRALTQNKHLAKQLLRLKAERPAQVIAQVDFGRKSAVDNACLMLGDAAGLAHPVCGNGMAMALRSADIAAALVVRFLRDGCSREQMENQYRRRMRQAFWLRRGLGRALQPLFEHQTTAEATVSVAGLFPSLTRGVLSLSHGRAF